MKISISATAWMPLAIFLLVFFFIPVSQLNGFAMMPGDIGDARLNNYFLENVYQFFAGNADSLWHLPFFFPFPYVLGFSDNLFGSAPVYALARLITGEADTAYQVWFLVGYAANFGSAYYALRRLNGSVLAASIGAVIFAFALPTTAHVGHAQLHYRFGLPLAIVFFVEFLNVKSWRLLLIAGAWLVWQFYAGVYMGFFALLLMATMSMAYVGSALLERERPIKDMLKDFRSSWQSQSRQQKLFALGGFGLLLLLLAILFYPYLQVANLYGAKRSWGEIATMLPRPQSFFLSDSSFLWATRDSRIFAGIPMRHEHQMFVGMVPLSLALAGFFVGSRARCGATFPLMGGMLGIAVVLTLYVGGFSLWYLFHKLPLASAIRAMTRLDQALLFPIAYLAVVAVDYFRTQFKWGLMAVLVLILPLLIFESGMTAMSTSLKQAWRQRLLELESVLPKDLPTDAILFFAQRSGPFYADELDVMWVSHAHGVKTMNGFSGIYPPGPGYEIEYGRDCSVIPRRVLSYLAFTQKSGDAQAYRALMARIVPIGFEGCDPAWFMTLPISSIDRAYTPEEFRHLSYGSGAVRIGDNKLDVEVVIRNTGTFPFSANSRVGKPIRVAWRFLDAGGIPISGWQARKNLPLDIPANGTLNVRIPVDLPKVTDANFVQVTLMQRRVFWAHDIGVSPITIPLK